MKMHRNPMGWWKERHVAVKAGIILGGIALAAGAFVLFGMMVMWLWNWLMPEIFGLPTIGFWQGWGLLALSSILFKGFGGGGDNGHARDRKKMRKHMEWQYHRHGWQECDEGREPGTVPDGPDTGGPDRGPRHDRGFHGGPGRGPHGHGDCQDFRGRGLRPGRNDRPESGPPTDGDANPGTPGEGQ